MSAILGVLFATIVAAIGLGQIMTLAHQGSVNTRMAVTAGQLKAIAAAAQTYVQTYYTQIEALSTSTAAATISVGTLQNAGMLSSGVSSTNPYGQTWQVQVLQPTTGVLQALVVSTGGQTIPAASGPAIAALAGAQGGFVPVVLEPGMSAAVAYGAYGGWQLSTAGYSNLGSGHLVALVDFNNQALTNDYLYRVAVPDETALNTMETNLDMGSNSITTANNVQANTASLARSDTLNPSQPGSLQIGSSYFYGDETNSAVRQSGSFSVQGTDGTPRDLNARTVAASQNVTSQNVIPSNYVELASKATQGAACSPNGAIAADTDSGNPGRLMNCQSGTWRYFLTGNVSFYTLGSDAQAGTYTGATMALGNHVYCALANDWNPNDTGSYPSDYYTIAANTNISIFQLPGCVIGSVFGSGCTSPPAFSLYRLADPAATAVFPTGAQNADGTYSWELERFGGYSPSGGAATCID